jgi:hypothetical protein
MPAPVEPTGLNGKEADILAGDDSHPKPPRKNGRALVWTVGTVVLFVILALGLGIGLGIGLKKQSSHGMSPSPATESGSPSGNDAPVVSVPTALPAWRLPADEYNLSMDWDLNAAPTTRVYNFTVGEIQAAPDGMSTPSLPCPL